ncbi:hypothetical protein HMPREF0765_0426 [Sphingobacterium spiritivorum ATCC 33300]|uniref:Uncharacterized protein n=1 Tax=Sphingobacterium spiritivorum ATCC 33300 TaxID=525372 RepID=C2FSX0_SPHSI|nr:hypothetical protein HMPREF0765_0426 [Sphingobacterium spiritivorum ATCC 33300]
MQSYIYQSVTLFIIYIIKFIGYTPETWAQNRILEEKHNKIQTTLEKSLKEIIYILKDLNMI